MPDEIKPFSPDEVDALERGRARSLTVGRLIATVRDRERERDESLALNRQGICTYCGHVETIPVGEDRTLGIHRIMVAHIENCPQHPLKRIAEIVDPIQAERDKLQRQLAEARNECHCAECWLRKHDARIAQGREVKK